jgi:4-hydroxythreonine-4-phosphate dehydrogenase
LIQDFSINKPKIAVLGLNPHCGDGGVIGEDDLILKPALKKIFDKGTLVLVLPMVFGSNNTKNDAVIATYHDQG